MWGLGLFWYYSQLTVEGDRWLRLVTTMPQIDRIDAVQAHMPPARTPTYAGTAHSDRRTRTGRWSSSRLRLRARSTTAKSPTASP